MGKSRPEPGVDPSSSIREVTGYHSIRDTVQCLKRVGIIVPSETAGHFLLAEHQEPCTSCGIPMEAPFRERHPTPVPRTG